MLGLIGIIIRKLLNNLDSQLFLYINNLPHNFVADFIFLFIHNLTKDGLIYFILAVYFLLTKRQAMMNMVTLATISGFTTYILNDLVLKNIFKRPRPFEVLSQINYVPPAPDSFSMPSGQSAVAFALLTIICLTVPNKKLQIGFGLFTLFVSFDRIYLGHHYPSDVLIGALVGMSVSYIMFSLRKSIFLFGRKID